MKKETLPKLIRIIDLLEQIEATFEDRPYGKSPIEQIFRKPITEVDVDNEIKEKGNKTQRIIALLEEDKSVADIAEIVGCSDAYVYGVKSKQRHKNNGEFKSL